MSHTTEPQTSSLPIPYDYPYPGRITLEVDATDVARHIFRVTERVPVKGGPLVLMFPKWLPGYHSPQTPIELLAGLELRAGGERLKWRRDLVEVYAFHVDVPDGTDAIEAEFQYLSPTSEAQGRVVVSEDMLNLEWNTVLLYPAGYYARKIEVEARLTLPNGWSFGCALDVAERCGNTIAFQPVPLDVLVDSPVLAGRHYRRLPLNADGSVQLSIVADAADLIPEDDDRLTPHRNLISQAELLFGAHHYERYEFMVALSDEIGGAGVEHHNSCEIATAPNYFSDWPATFPKRDVFAHEYVHSWNGKFRRGADSWIANFDRPIGNSLMWVYEGLTQYWGQVLSARSGLWTAKQTLEALARTAATYDMRAGHRWRPLSDTTRDPIIAGRAPLPWASWQRSEDYYSEGQLIWLDVDTLIREITEDQHSLDDFAARFFGQREAAERTETYEFEDVINELTQVAPFDWAGLLTQRLENTDPGAPLDGLRRGGYELVYEQTPSAFGAAADQLAGLTNLSYSIGLIVSTKGIVQEVIWESPAFHAGVIAGAEIADINDHTFSTTELTNAVGWGQPVKLLLKIGKHHRCATIAYTDGHRYPHLHPIEGSQRHRLDEILRPLGPA